MASLKDRSGEKIHNRSIAVDSYPLSEDEIIFTGTLIDTRYKEYVLSTGEVRPPGVIHHMIIRMLVHFPDFEIKELETEMPGHPRPECIQTRDCLAPLIGSMIGPGLTAKVKKTAGGNRGCAHLVNLMLAMAPSIVQGYWSHKSSKTETAKQFFPDERMSNFLVDTCFVWRDGGESIQKLRIALEKNNK